MCLILLDWDTHPDYQLVIAANRDEFHDRPSQQAEWWHDHPSVLGGRDLEAHGTWLAINHHGHFGAVTNVRKVARGSIKSRGHIATNFLTKDKNLTTYLNVLDATKDQFDGYNFVGFDGQTLAWYNNVEATRRLLSKGTYGLSNASLDTEWPKVSRLKLGYQKICSNHQPFIASLFALLGDNLAADDERLPDTGVGIEMERQLSPIFIEGVNYGTRCSTIYTLDRAGNASLCERRFDRNRRLLGEQCFEFEIVPTGQ